MTASNGSSIKPSPLSLQLMRNNDAKNILHRSKAPKGEEMVQLLSILWSVFSRWRVHHPRQRRCPPINQPETEAEKWVPSRYARWWVLLPKTFVPKQLQPRSLDSWRYLRDALCNLKHSLLGITVVICFADNSSFWFLYFWWLQIVWHGTNTNVGEIHSISSYIRKDTHNCFMGRYGRSHFLSDMKNPSC